MVNGIHLHQKTKIEKKITKLNSHLLLTFANTRFVLYILFSFDSIDILFLNLKDKILLFR